MSYKFQIQIAVFANWSGNAVLLHDEDIDDLEGFVKQNPLLYSRLNKERGMEYVNTTKSYYFSVCLFEPIR